MFFRVLCRALFRALLIVRGEYLLSVLGDELRLIEDGSFVAGPLSCGRSQGRGVRGGLKEGVIFRFGAPAQVQGEVRRATAVVGVLKKAKNN